VNIEPATDCFEKLRAERPRDQTLQVALGNREGWARLHELPDTGLSTLVESVAAGHQANGFKCVERRVPFPALDRVWQKFVNGEVHFPKIDVEGYERQVLSGTDPARFHPWIILVEATEQLSSEANWEKWERVLVRARYRPVHFDGLNRWYLARQRSYLTARPETPPNVFDQFQLAAMVSLRERAAKAEFTVKQMQSSASWRIKARLRKLKDGSCVSWQRIRDHKVAKVCGGSHSSGRWGVSTSDFQVCPLALALTLIGVRDSPSFREPICPLLPLLTSV
jgi:FkbM family methyltransferase